MLEKDTELFKVNLTEVFTISKHRFKMFVNKKSEELTFEFLFKQVYKWKKVKGIISFDKENRELLFKLR